MRGGKRPGSGRPSLGRSVVLYARLHPKTLVYIDYMCLQYGVSRSEFLDMHFKQVPLSSKDSAEPPTIK